MATSSGNMNNNNNNNQTIPATREENCDNKNDVDKKLSSSSSASNQTDNSNKQTTGRFGTEILFPAAMRAIEEDNLDKLKEVIKLENFNKESLDSLVYKACERSKDITIEENYVKNSGNISDSEEEQSMLSACMTARKNNEKMLELLVEAESNFDEETRTRLNNKRAAAKTFNTPQKPVLKSSEKKFLVTQTPEMPKFKSRSVRRELKY